MSRPSSANVLVGAFAAVVLLFVALIVVTMAELSTPAREAAASAPTAPAPITTAKTFPPPEPRAKASGLSTATVQPTKLNPKEIPFPVPYLTNAKDRAALKRWWVADFAKRLDLWKQEHPGNYPDSKSIAAQLYDASEPAPGQDDAHHRELSARLADFMKTYGTSPGSVISWSAHKHTAPNPPPGFALEESEPTFEVASTTAPEGFVPGQHP